MAKIPTHMKRIVPIILAASFAAVSCSKDSLDSSQDGERIKTHEGSSIAGQFHSLNESFEVKNKDAAALKYTYRAFAEPPMINGIRTNATAIQEHGDYVFVTWHTVNQPYGGAISAYRYDFVADEYSYVSRVDFVDTDFHELFVKDNNSGPGFHVYVTGQRDPDASGYFLDEHEGAIVGRITFTPGSGVWDPLSYEELPLPGLAGNAVNWKGMEVIVVTGNGIGGASAMTADNGIYRLDLDLTNVATAQDKAELTDGEYVAKNTFGAPHADYAVLERTSPSEIRLMSFDVGEDLTTYAMGGGAGATFPSSASNVERNAITWASDNVVLMALGSDGLVSYDFGANMFNMEANVGAASGVAVDDMNKLVYYAAGDGGLYVLAGVGYPGGVLIDDFDLIGKFTPPTSGNLPGQFDVKDASIFQGDKLALAGGLGGVYFVNKD